MIDFDDELKKFEPSEEINEAEEAVYNRDLTDLTDAMIAIMNGDRG